MPNHVDDSGYTVEGVIEPSIVEDIVRKDKNAKNHLKGRVLTLKNKNETIYKFNHIHYKHWPDMSVPEGETRNVLFELATFVRGLQDKGINVLIHCSGGTGRSGSFITSILTHGLDPTKYLNMFEFITELRKIRSYMVETDTQLGLIADYMKRTQKKL